MIAHPDLAQIRIQVLGIIAAMHIPGKANREDLEGFGLLGYVLALCNYEPARGVPLKSYAEYRIRGQILEYLRSIDPCSRGQRQAIKAGLEAEPTARKVLAAELYHTRAEGREIIASIDLERAMQALTARQRYVIREYFWAERGLREIGKDLRVNESRASQIKTAALRKLREAMGAAQ